MRGTTDEGLALGSHLRIGLDPGLTGEIAVRWESLFLLEEAYSAKVSYQVSDSGVTFTAEVNGLKCIVGWEPKMARVVAIAAPELSEDFIFWCMGAHMNLVNVHCMIAVIAGDEFASKRILAAATASISRSPNRAIEMRAAHIASLCEKHGFDRLWCTTQPASAMEDVNAVEVTLVYERHLGELAEGTAELERAIATLIGFRVHLTWRKPTTSDTRHALKLANAREVWKAAK